MLVAPIPNSGYALGIGDLCAITLGVRVLAGKLPLHVLEEMSETGIHRVPKCIAQQIEREHRSEDCQAGEDRDPPGRLNVLATPGDEGAPFRQWRLGTCPNEAQARSQ